MLAGKYRINGSYYIDRAKKFGKIYQFKDFGLCVYKREENDTNPTRFAFVVSTKVAKHAVDRNRVKRAISEPVRFETIHLRTGFDVVFLVKQSIMKETSESIMKQTKEALAKSKLLNFDN